MCEIVTLCRIAHLSDLHLGYRATKKVGTDGVNVREADGYLAFQELVQSVLDHDVDVVVVAGDVFHTPSPSVRTVLVAQEGFRRLAGAGIRVYILAGNHDTKDVRTDIAGSKILDDRSRGIFSDVDPLTQYHIHDDITLHMISHHAYTGQSATMEKISTSPGINILSTHGSVIDPVTRMRMSTEDSPREIIVPDATLYDNDWDYVLLGHIHERGWVSPVSGGDAPPVYYNGSLIRRGFADKACELGRGWTQWDVTESGEFIPTMHTVEQRPQFDLPVIDATNLSASELTESVVENIRNMEETQDSPIVRQEIKNITPGKRGGMDWKSIGVETQDMLDWKVKFSSPQTESHSASVESPGGTKAGDVHLLDAYDNWVETASSLQGVSPDAKPRVCKTAKNLIQKEVENELHGE